MLSIGRKKTYDSAPHTSDGEKISSVRLLKNESGSLDVRVIGREGQEEPLRHMWSSLTTRPQNHVFQESACTDF